MLSSDCNIRTSKRAGYACEPYISSPFEPAAGRSAKGYSARSFGQSLGEILVQSVHEAFGVKPGLIRTNEHGEILGHLTAFNGRHDDLLQSFGEILDFRSVIQVGAVLETGRSKPKIDAIGLVEVFSPFCQRR
mgnify:CR=1 FL=1